MKSKPSRQISRRWRPLGWAMVIAPFALVAGYLGAGAVIASRLTRPKRQFYLEAADGLGVL